MMSWCLGACEQLLKMWGLGADNVKSSSKGMSQRLQRNANIGVHTNISKAKIMANEIAAEGTGISTDRIRIKKPIMNR
jgi:hypothetical protein